jgi:hypothetical protein
MFTLSNSSIEEMDYITGDNQYEYSLEMMNAAEPGGDDEEGEEEEEPQEQPGDNNNAGSEEENPPLDPGTVHSPVTTQTGGKTKP